MKTSVVLMIAGLLLVGCSSGGGVSRAQARGAVTATAAAVHAVDEICAETAKAKRDIELARRCSHAYDVARSSVVVTAIAVDHWDDVSSSRQSVACAMRGALDGLDSMIRETEAAGAKMPPLVNDALALATIVGMCPDDVPRPMSSGGQ